MINETYTQILTLLDLLSPDEKLQLISDITQNLRIDDPLVEETEEEEPEVDQKKRVYLPRMAKLLEWGVVKVGDRLYVEGHKDRAAMLLNKNEVVYDGRAIRINDWVMNLLDWESVSIYRHVIVEREGKLLNDLRREAMLARGMDYPEHLSD